MSTNPLLALEALGQSVWLDYIRRHLLTSGELARLIEQDGLGGVTSNPSIFEKAIAGSTDYAEALAAAGRRAPCATIDLYESLAIADIQDAADLLRGVYERAGRRDGYVSFEVSPLLAADTAGTIAEARRLWTAIGRDNVMIKVPGTPEGTAAIRTLVGNGLNINVTLLFSQVAYDAVAEAYLAGLEACAATGGDLSRVASVASFFVSRIDAAVDEQIDAKLASATSAAGRERLRSLKGRIAIANAKRAYQRYKEIISTPRWRALASRGAQPQRLLWASTGTKNPAYRDTLYVEELIGPDTVNTIPPATLDAFRDHGRPRLSLEEEVEQSRAALAALEDAGISLDVITSRLVQDGVGLFADAFHKLLAAIDQKRAAVAPSHVERQRTQLPPPLAEAVSASIRDWQDNRKTQRLWARDPTLWTGADEDRWLGWLGVTDDQLAHLDRLRAVAHDARTGDVTDVLLLGMGGSSLCPDVLASTFGRLAGFPALHVLDSTDPAQVAAVAGDVDLAHTLVIVSSKSGSTLEPNILFQYFFERVTEAIGASEAPKRFVAITDPGSKLQQVAERYGFHRICHGLSSIGGRYSALSDFGMVPAAAMGLDVGRFLDRAEEMVHSCAACVPAPDNPGVALGAVLGTLGAHGRDKVTLVTSPAISGLGGWLEQLIAESTGKRGKGLIPIDGERLGAPAVYGDDRLFVYLRLTSKPDTTQDAALDALERAGQPVVRLVVDDPYDLGQEFFRWEIATAVAGSILGINPFDQPDVEASKIATRKLTDDFETHGSLPAEAPFLAADGLTFFADAKNAAALAPAGDDGAATSCLRAHLARLGAGDYFGLLSYVARSARHDAPLQAIRHAVRDRTRAATCLGYGPRFLHSTGQAYKGGPNSGVFLQITCDDAADLPVPGQKYTFGIVKAAQARGDFEVLAARGRRLLRVHLGADVAAGLERLRTLVHEALA